MSIADHWQAASERARWETPDALEESREDIRTSVDMFRLRRVDGDVVTARSW